MAVCPLLGACATLGTGTKPAPVSAAKVLRAVPEVENSSNAPCWQQRQIAAQRSYIHSAIRGKSVKYHADCKEGDEQKVADAS